ncbi:MAG: sigma-70 family RNA polymerase sigma factor [Bacteroidota bacterium]
MSKAALQAEFIRLLSTQQKLIHGLCSLYFPLAEDRKDLFQEIVLQLWKAYPSFKGESKVSTWIYRIALNTVFTRIRKERSCPKSESISEKVWEIPNPEELDGLDEATQALYQGIRQLGELDRAIIMLYLDENSYDEIATLLELSKTNVSTRINRIKIKLEKLLTPRIQWI